MKLDFSAISDVGRVRKDNQDSGYAGPHLLAVCDGVGGAARGDIASATTIQQLRALDDEAVPPVVVDGVEDSQSGDALLTRISEAIRNAHDRIAALVDEDPALEGTSTTATLALFDGARVPEAARAAEPKGRERRTKQAAKQPAKRRGSPTHVLVVEGSNSGQRADLDAAPILIGRGTDAAIRLDDDYVSTRHARIAASGDQWFVEDLGSTNGTYIGTVRITQPTTITLGTQVRIGKTILELRK